MCCDVNVGVGRCFGLVGKTQTFLLGNGEKLSKSRLLTEKSERDFTDLCCIQN